MSKIKLGRVAVSNDDSGLTFKVFRGSWQKNALKIS